MSDEIVKKNKKKCSARHTNLSRVRETANDEKYNDKYNFSTYGYEIISGETYIFRYGKYSRRNSLPSGVNMPIIIRVKECSSRSLSAALGGCRQTLLEKKKNY